MARSSKDRSPGAGAVTINMTPMIDCTFLLIIFFILTTQIVNASFEQIVVAAPLESHAKVDDKNKDEPANIVTVNVVSAEKPDDVEWTPSGFKGPGDGDKSRKLSHYSVDGVRIEGNELTGMLLGIFKEKLEKAKKAGYEELILQIRADARLPYNHVSNVFVVANRAGIKQVRLTAADETDE